MMASPHLTVKITALCAAGLMVPGLKPKITDRKVLLRLGFRAGARAEPELRGVNQRQGLFEEEFNRTVEVIA